MQLLEDITNRFCKLLGNFIAIVLIIMMINVAFDTFNRYLFNSNYMALQELEWHLFSVVILLGMSYTMNKEGHVRVDILYNKFSTKTKALVNMFGVVIFVAPISFLILYGSIDFVLEAYVFMEESSNPGGLHYRFIIKSLIPISFFILIFTSLGYFATNYNIWKRIKLKEYGK